MGLTKSILGAVAGGCATAMFLAAASGPAVAETLRISGDGGAVAGIARVVKAFCGANPGVRAVISRPVGSSGGIRAAIAGKLDIGVSARPLTLAERAMGGSDIPYARTPFVFAVNPSVVRSDISLNEAVAIYGGRIARWEDGGPVRLVLRPADSVESAMLRRMSPRMAAALARAQGRQGMIIARTDEECAHRLETTPGAFGTTTLAMALSGNRRIKVLSLSGVTPSAESVRDGSYPYAETFHLVTGPRPAPVATRFIAFIRSPAGASILARTAHAPLP
jgi:phosphate transport system substrate-binding protein